MTDKELENLISNDNA